MSIRDQFIKEINVNPDDDVIKLIYADWLEDKNPDLATGWRLVVEYKRKPVKCKDGYKWWFGFDKEMKRQPPEVLYLTWSGTIRPLYPNNNSFFSCMEWAAIYMFILFEKGLL